MKNTIFGIFISIIILSNLVFAIDPEEIVNNGVYIGDTPTPRECFNFADGITYSECVAVGEKNQCYCIPASIFGSFLYSYGLPDNCMEAKYKYCSQYGTMYYNCGTTEVCSTCTRMKMYYYIRSCYKDDPNYWSCLDQKINDLRDVITRNGYYPDHYELKDCSYDWKYTCIYYYFAKIYSYECNCRTVPKTCEKTICTQYDYKVVPVSELPTNAQDVTCVKYGDCANGQKKTKTCYDGTVITEYVCQDFQWIRTTESCPIIDPCKDVVCNDTCDGYTFKSGGTCVVQNNQPKCVYSVIQSNSTKCGYIPTEIGIEKPKEEKGINIEIVAVVLFVLVIISIVALRYKNFK